ncbi:UNVERIFIED_CONTAM: hypothetical protein RMT77_010339 [Armadillidium vulgare]
MDKKILVFCVTLALLFSLAVTQPLVEDGVDGEVAAIDDYNDLLERLLARAQKRSSLIYLFRRSCIRRGGTCDHRPNDCCYSSSCRCNLWGSNCRCQRAGLFQQWGK